MKTVVTEAHVQQTVREFLEWDGWRSIRTDPVSDRSRGKGFGEVGMPDYLFIRYFMASVGPCEMSDPAEQALYNRCGVLWVEFKRKGAKLRGHQEVWHAEEKARGALVMVVDDIDEFIAWYKASGLQRKR